jgi:tetratricopeptide (TPR) repeat protein
MYLKRFLVWFGLGIFLTSHLFPQNILVQSEMPQGAVNNSDSSLCIIVIKNDSSSVLLNSLQQNLIQRGQCVKIIPDTLRNAKLLGFKNHPYSLYIQGSLLIVECATSLPDNTPLWYIAQPFLPDMQIRTKYPQPLDSTNISQIPSIIELAQGHVDSLVIAKSFPSKENPLSPLLLRAIIEYHKAAQQDSMNQIHDIYSRLLNSPKETSLLSGWLFYNYAAIVGVEKEKEFYQQADSLFELAGESLGQALCQLALARADEQYETASLYFSSILDYCDIHQDSVTEAKVYMAMAELSKKSGQSTATETLLIKAAIAHEKIGDMYNATLLYTELGQVERTLGRLDSSDNILKKALNMARAMQSETNILKIHFQLALTKTALGEIDSAIVNYNLSTDLMEMLGDRLGLAKVDNKLGTIHLNRNEHDLARAKYESALNLFFELNDSSGILQSHFNLGELAADQQRWEKSQFHFGRALDIARNMGNDKLVGSVLYAKGIALFKEGDLGEGYERIKESFDLTDGAVYGTRQESERFLTKLEALIEGEKEILSKKKAIESNL